MHVLVVGGAGYVGGVTAERLLDDGHEVTILDDLSTGHPKAADPRAKLIAGSVLDLATLGRTFAEGRYDAVMHFAAKSIVPQSMQEPGRYFANNISGVITLLTAMLPQGVSRLVFSSTAAVYGEPAVVPIPEISPLQPNNPYGESKATVERLLPWYASQSGLKYAALRYFNAAGATERVGEWHRPETHLIPLAMQSVLGQRGPLTIYGTDYPTPDGTAVRDYVHVRDLADAHVRALHHLMAPAPGSIVCNLGSSAGHSVREVLAAVGRATGRAVPIELGDRRTGDAPITVASNTRAADLLGWRPERDIDDIVTSAWKWLRAHPNGYTAQW